MQDKKIIFAPAKLNIFLKVLGRRADGYHEIRSGVTFINLYDQIQIEKSLKTTIYYTGDFKPKGGAYKDCIIERTLNFLNINKKVQLKINIIKSIPVQGGLGSASTNAAALIIALEEMNLIEYKNPDYYVSLGADIPCFLFKKNCLVAGKGEKLVHFSFPKYFFLLVKPKFNNSTKDMYEKLRFKDKIVDQNLISEKIEINEKDTGNDFDKITLNENVEYRNIIDYLENVDHSIFVRMTGSGSCCYAVFEKKEYALKASTLFKSKFSDLWSIVCENNTINN